MADAVLVPGTVIGRQVHSVLVACLPRPSAGLRRLYGRRLSGAVPAADDDGPYQDHHDDHADGQRHDADQEVVGNGKLDFVH